jgi:DNA-directed RNA polymerase subunit beta'
MLDDNDPKKFIAKMGADALEMLVISLTIESNLSYDLRHQQQRNFTSAQI